MTRREPLQLSLFSEPTVSVKEAAHFLGISETGVKRLLDSGILRGYQHVPGGQHYILRQSLLDHESNMREKAQWTPTTPPPPKNREAR